MKYILKSAFLPAMLLAMALLPSCSSKGEEEAAQASAAELEHAMMKGREAARVFVNTTWKDTIQLQNQLLEASAKRSEFAGHPELEQKFDSAFISTVRTVRPAVAEELEKKLKQ